MQLAESASTSPQELVLRSENKLGEEGNRVEPCDRV